MIALIVGSVQHLHDKVADFERVDVGETGTVSLDGTGGFTIYHEYDGAYSSTGFGGDVAVEMTGPDGTNVSIEPYVANVTYSTGGHEGVALYSFRAEQPGQYTLQSDGSGGTLAVGRGVGKDLFGRIAAGILVGILGLVLGAVLAIVVGVQRGRDRRRRFISATPNYWPGPPGGPGAWGGPPQYPPPYQPPQPPGFG